MSGQTPGLQDEPVKEPVVERPPKFDAERYRLGQERREDQRQAALGMAAQWAGQHKERPGTQTLIDAAELFYRFITTGKTVRQVDDATGVSQ